MHPRTLLAVAVLVLAAAVGTASAAPDAAPAGQPSIDCEFPYSATDATGTAVTVPEEPARVVTLAPSAAQTMWEIGGREKVVGVSQHAAYLDGAGERTNVSGAGTTFVNVERVIGLQPDLVLAPHVVPDATVEQLRAAGLTVYNFEYEPTIAAVEEKTLLTGRLAGECDGAEETVDWMESELDTVAAAVEGADRPRVLYVFFGYTAGSDTVVDAVIERAGGTNVAAAANVSGFAQLSPEVVVERDPEWIVVNDAAPGVPESEAYNGTTAVRNDQVVVLDEDYVSQPAPRVVRSVVTLAKALHPDAYERATATATPTGASAPETTTTTTTTTDEPTATPTEAGGTTTGSPGFGVTAAVVALATLVLLARRR